MTELPRADATEFFEARMRGLAAVEAAVADPRSEVAREMVEISLWVRGRELRTRVDNETIHRLVAILTGEL